MSTSAPTHITIASDALRAVTAAYELTEREAEVLYWMLEGERDREIARELGVSVRTTEHHVSSVLHKLGARTRATAVRIALQKIHAASKSIFSPFYSA